VLLTGVLRATDAENIIVPRTPSSQVQIRWLEDDGTRVTVGQKIVELDNSAFAGTIEEKKLALNKAEKEHLQQQAQNDAQEAEKIFQLEQSRSALEKAEIDANVPEELLSLRDYQDRMLAHERARIAYEKATEDLDSFRKTVKEDLAIYQATQDKARHEIRIAEEAIRALTLNAPRDGIFVTSFFRGAKLQAGDTVWARLTVARIPDLTSMEVEASLSDVDDGRIQLGMKAVCTLDAYPELEFPGTVAGIAPIAQETAPRSLRRAFRETVALDRSDPERMRPGMAVQVAVAASRVSDALLAPRAALLFDEGGTRAVLENGEEHPVEIGICDALECVIEDGLSAGTRLGSSQGRKP
jgi:multidrug efflux pump subunit AcrA (membrane-fusion protein)